MQAECGEVASRPRAADLIAGLSLCMLAAAWGTTLGPEWCTLWAVFGAFGLASALGLNTLNRSRVRMKLAEHQKQMTRRAEKSLAKATADLRSSEAICPAVRRITQDADDAEPQGRIDRAEPRQSLNKQPSTVLLCRLTKPARDRSGESSTVCVRNFSRRGVGLAHSRPVELGAVLLTFTLKNGEVIRFMADLLWCEPQGDGLYFSGARLIELVAPSAWRQDSEPTTQRQ